MNGTGEQGQEMPELVRAPRLRDLCARHGIRFKKGLGQNLLLDDNINTIMVDAANLTPEDSVIEVGAGLGALTRRLCRKAGRLLSVEIDASFIPCLEEQFGGMPNVRLFRGDILNHSLGTLVDEYLPESQRLKMVSNLPYYITTPILFHFLESPLFFSRIVVMVQLEVGQRLVAAANTGEYGVLTIASALHAEVDLVHRVPATCFLPRPKVDSCIVRFRCHENPPVGAAERRFVMKVVRAAFSQRRKTLRNALAGSGGFGVPRDAVLEAMEAAGVDGGRRAQTVSLDEFVRLAGEIRKRLPAQAGDSGEGAGSGILAHNEGE
ncbi:MAG: 16S rRNA (adenine(1518)-N(6)/adenine(1519)-N(6))-dimethyltransferase RsmA [Candidatus Hydrogenedentes bacterium]|nr:16S rRNA (adenine(1518)-N(6)/adenine(1519)-N(6))-dimethyltransferase RsmA [Candidatus Hydrogenedentota bacterium]